MEEIVRVEDGRRVWVEYRGTLEDGEEFDKSEDQEPLEFEVGNGEVIPGFEENLIGMTVGDEKVFTLEPEEAYGERREELVVDVDPGELPADIDVGDVLPMELEEGAVAEGVVVEVGEESVTVDFNHPLAGRALTFEVRILDIE